jgi:hypothetical protein
MSYAEIGLCSQNTDTIHYTNPHDSQIATRMRQLPSRADPIGGDQKHQWKILHQG